MAVKRRVLTPDEYRNEVITMRISRVEYDELYMLSRSRGTTMSYLIRQALEDAYPNIFENLNRYRRKPKRPEAIPHKTRTLKSFDGKSIRVVDDWDDL